MSFKQLARTQRFTHLRRSEEAVLHFSGFPHGINTSVSPFRIKQSEAAAMINWVIRPGGKLVTRDAINVYTTTAAASNASVDTIEQVSIGGTQYTMTVDANFKLDYLDSDPKPVNIGTTEGATQLTGYNGVAVVLDGSFIKYCDGVSSIKMAYDAGTGTSGYQFDFTGETDDTFLAMGNGTNNGVCQKFTTQAWETGYTVPIVKASVYLSQVGTAAANVITATLRNFSDASAVETMTLVADATDVAATATQYTATFTGVSNEMAKSTAYFMCIEHTGGSAGNYIKVHCNTVSGTGGAWYNDGTLTNKADWNADVNKDSLMYMSPGMPPKGAFGEVRGNRLFVAGDPDNPGYVWYSNLTHLDWSTSDGGGFLGAVDDNANNFEVGGLAAVFGDLYIYGKENQPYLSQLTGASPSSFVQALVFQRPWTNSKAIVSAVNDIWAGSGDGISNLRGVTEYGDLRTFTASDPVKDRIDDYWSSSTAFAKYYPTEGQYWLVMPSYHRVLISHTKLPIEAPDGQLTRYPWCEYEFYRKELTDTDTYKWTASGSGTNEYYVELLGGGDPGFVAAPDFITMDGAKLTEGTVGSLSDHQYDYGNNDTLGYSTVYVRDETGDPDATGVVIREVMVPTSLGSVGNTWLLGGSDGFVYDLDSTNYKDQTAIQIKPKLLTSYIEMPMSYVHANTVQLLASSTGGGSMNLKFFTNGLQVQQTKTLTLPVDDGLTVEQALMDVDDAYFLVDPSQDRLFYHVNLNFMSVMLSFADVILSGTPIYLSGALIKYRPLRF